MNAYPVIPRIFRAYWLLPLFVLICLSGCTFNHIDDLHPSGPISRAIDELFWTTVALMSLIMIPVFSMTAWFIWHYRASNNQAQYSPDWDTSVVLEWLVWLFPAVIVLILTSMTWVFTHRLDPYKPIVATESTLEIQAIAMDWKWLFIYPQQQIAVVNELTIPVGRPIAFKITSNTVMNAFFIPRLGGQINAMAGMETQLHLIADQSGDYFGENIQYSGRGFPFQHFIVHATSSQDFTSWIAMLKQSPNKLDFQQFEQLAKPSVKDPVSYYAQVSPGLFQQILDQFKAKPNTH